MFVKTDTLLLHPLRNWGYKGFKVPKGKIEYFRYSIHYSTDSVVHFIPKYSKIVKLELPNETVWLTQQRIADLFGIDRSMVTKILRNIFQSLELQEYSVCAKIAHTAADGKTYNTQFYKLDAIRHQRATV